MQKKTISCRLILSNFLDSSARCLVFIRLGIGLYSVAYPTSRIVVT